MSADIFLATGNAGIMAVSTINGVSDIRSKPTTLTEKVGKAAGIGNDFGCLLSSGAAFIPTTAQAGLAASGALGPAGAIIGLATDCITLAIRSGRVDELRKILAEIPEGEGQQYKRDIIAACHAHASGMVTSSTVAVAADTVGVGGSFVPVLGLPATAVGFSVAVVRVFAEKGMDKALKNRLQDLTDAYSKENPELVKNPQGLKDLHRAIKDAHTQSLTVKDQAQNDLDDVMEAHRKLGSPKEGLPRVVKAREALFAAEVTLKQTEFDLHECETALANLEAYGDALNLIPELDEMIKKEKEQRDIIRHVESDLRKRGSTFSTVKSELEKNVKSLEKELSPKNIKEHEDHSISMGVHSTYHREVLIEDLRKTKAALHNYTLYPKACKDIEKLDKTRAEMDRAAAAQRAEEQRRLQEQPLSHDNLLTPTTLSATLHAEPKKTNIHVHTDSRHLSKIHVPPTPQSAPVRFFSPPSVNRMNIVTPTEKVPSPITAHTDLSPPLSPQSGLLFAPSPSLISSHEESRKLPLDMVRVEDPLSPEELRKQSLASKTNDNGDTHEFMAISPTPSPVSSKGSTSPVSRSETESVSPVILKTEEPKTEEPMSAVSSEPQSAKFESMSPSSNSTKGTESPRSVVHKTTVASRAKRREKFKSNTLHVNTNIGRRSKSAQTVLVGTV